MAGDVAVAATYSTAFEAEVAVAVLKGVGVPAHARGNDIVGIFGPGFQGPTPQGVDVLVPRTMLSKARMILARHKGD